MGIFDPVNAGNPDAPISTVAQYQRAMNRATYSPAVAQAAARSGVNPTLATRIASREVAQQMGQALPALIQQDAAAMEARRLENERKERERIAMMLNSGGQVLGTVLNAYSGGTMGAATNGAGGSSQGAQIRPVATSGYAGANVGAQSAPLAAAPQTSIQTAPIQQFVQAPAPAVAAQAAPLVDQPIYNTPAQTPGAPVISSALLASQPVSNPIANQYLQDSADADILREPSGRPSRRRPRRRGM